MTKELHPRNCLIRLCRFCKIPMVRTNYEWDSEYRWYTFYCEFCEHATTIGEPINEEYHLGYENGIEHEPLTSEELGQDTHDKYKKSSSHQFSTKFKEENR